MYCTCWICWLWLVCLFPEELYFSPSKSFNLFFSQVNKFRASNKKYTFVKEDDEARLGTFIYGWHVDTWIKNALDGYCAPGRKMKRNCHLLTLSDFRWMGEVWRWKCEGVRLKREALSSIDDEREISISISSAFNIILLLWFWLCEMKASFNRRESEEGSTMMKYERMDEVEANELWIEVALRQTHA